MNRAEKRRQRKLAKKAAKKERSAQSDEPSTGQHALTLALQHHSAGRLPEAEAIFRQILETDPNQPVALHQLGVIAQQVGKSDTAVDLITRALTIKPDYAEAHNNLGAVLQGLGQLDKAIASHLKALAIIPDYAEAHYNLGNAFKEHGRLDEAVACYLKALAINQNYTEAHYNLGTVRMNLGKLDKAMDSFGKAIAVKPDFAEAHNNLGNVLQGLGRLDKAVASYRTALAINPDYADAHNNLGVALQDLGRMDEAVASYHKILAIKPDFADAHYNLGIAYHDLGQLTEAVASYLKALAINPDYAKAHNNLGNAQKDLGLFDEAAASYRKALAIEPDDTETHSNLIFTRNCTVSYTSKELLDQARRYGEYVAAQARPISNHSNSPDPDRPLRVGLVSGNFQNHPVGYFILGFLPRINTENIEFFAYATAAFEDDLTATIKTNVSKWRMVTGVADEQLAMDMVDDRIDILVDLSGHTSKNRLSLFAWKPAPIQVTWIGYFATTGLKAIDYIFCDRWVLPPEEEAHFVETPCRLPDSYLCFTPPDLDINVTALPAESAGHITFGCFNNLAKMNAAVISSWSRVLHAAPDSRLFLKTKQLNGEASQQDVSNRFSDHGISTDRLILEGHSPRDALLASYNRVDICLDPFPYPGGTTSVEALWMGVPVLTLQGDRFLSHIGESILHNVGLDDWVASSPENYVEIARKYSSNLPMLAAMRNGLRERIVTSPMCDASRFAQNLENSFRHMWRVWCEQQGEL